VLRKDIMLHQARCRFMSMQCSSVDGDGEIAAPKSMSELLIENEQLKA